MSVAAFDPQDAAPNVVHWLERHRADMLEMLRHIVDTPSHASQREGIAKVAAAITGPLAAIGFEVEEHPQVPLRDDLAWVADVMSPAVSYGALGGTFVARRAAPGRPVLLLGDLDTAAAPDAGPMVPFRMESGRAYGSGIADMKGGLVTATWALRASHELALPVPPITFVLSGDEQAGSLGSRRVIEREASSAAWCFGLECARSGGRLMHSRAHIGIGRMEAVGREAHAGTAHARGVNAIDALARAIPVLHAVTDAQAGVFVTVTLVSGGRRRSVVPAYASATLDVRTPDADAWERTAKRIRSAVAGIDGSNASLRVRLHAHRPGFVMNDESGRLLETVREAGGALGMAVEAEASAAAGSTAFAGANGVPTVDGMGPSGGDLMTHGEHIALDSLVPRAALLALSLASLATRR